MKLFKAFTLCLIIHSTIGSTLANGPDSPGARAAALGGTALTLADPWSVFNNGAGLPGVEHFHTIFNFHNAFGVSDLNTYSAAFIFPLKESGAGVSLSRFGSKNYHQSRLSVAYGHKIGQARVGARLAYVQHSFGELGARGSVTADLGGIMDLTPALSLGMHVSNLNQARIGGRASHKMPVVMSAGLAYRPSKQLQLNAEVEKDIGLAPRLKAGLEYQVITRVFLRTGLSGSPLRSSIGLGFKPGKLDLSYAADHVRGPGFSHYLSLGYRLHQK